MKKNGFTLVELLIVIAILGVLTTIGLVAFNSAQMRGRDSQRKSDLKQISTALELYFSDHGSYPTSTNGKINGCPSTTATSCNWGTGEFTDGSTTYFRALPEDPSSNLNYYYRSVSVNGAANQGFQIFAKLENTQDPQIIETVYSCGTTNCNFAITSPNTTSSD